MKRIYYFSILTSLLLALTSCGELYEADEEEDGNKVEAKLTLGRTSVDLMVGDKFKIPVTMEPDSLKDYAVSWVSDNTGVVSISTDTLVAESSGDAKVTVTWVGQKLTASANVHVLPVWKWEDMKYKYPYDMAIFAKVTVNNRPADADCVVAAFDADGDLRGVGQLMKEKNIDYMLLRIYSPSTDIEDIYLSCYDRKAALLIELKDPISFVASGTEGSLSDLYDITFK